MYLKCVLAICIILRKAVEYIDYFELYFNHQASKLRKVSFLPTLPWIISFCGFLARIYPSSLAAFCCSLLAMDFHSLCHFFLFCASWYIFCMLLFFTSALLWFSNSTSMQSCPPGFICLVHLAFIRLVTFHWQSWTFRIWFGDGCYHILHSCLPSNYLISLAICNS